MELQLYLEILKRRALVIIITASLSLVVVTAWGLLTPPMYTAYTTVRVLLDMGVTDFLMREEYNLRLMNTYQRILESDPILQKAIDQLQPRTDGLKVVDLRERLKIEVIPNTELISISVQDEDPAVARDLADTLAELLIQYTKELYVGSNKSTLQVVEDQLKELGAEIDYNRKQLSALLAQGQLGPEVDDLRNQIKFKEESYDRLFAKYESAQLNEALKANSITVLSPATLPTYPTNSLGITQVGLSLIVGAFSGIGLALVMENLDTRIRSPQQLERVSNQPVLGSVPAGMLADTTSEKSLAARVSRPIEEAYRLLSINLPALKGVVTVQTILITSALPREGKSTVAINLARTIAEKGQIVFLIEADLRRPQLMKKLGLESAMQSKLGLGKFLSRRLSLNQELLSRMTQPTKWPGLFVIGGYGAGGNLNPTAMLAAPSMEELLSYLSTQGYMSLIDSPPVLGMADVSVLAPKVDGVLLVAREGLSKREQVLAALKQLRASDSNLLGTVFIQRSDKGWGYE